MQSYERMGWPLEGNGVQKGGLACEGMYPSRELLGNLWWGVGRELRASEIEVLEMMVCGLEACKSYVREWEVGRERTEVGEGELGYELHDRCALVFEENLYLYRNK